MTQVSPLFIILVGLAGACGAVTRYLVTRLFLHPRNKRIVLATIIINVSGALLIGLLFTLTARHRLSGLLQTTLATGFLGGYTTFSTMCWEAYQMLRQREYHTSVVYLTGNIVPGLTAALLGYWIGGLGA